MGMVWITKEADSSGRKKRQNYKGYGSANSMIARAQAIEGVAEGGIDKRILFGLSVSIDLDEQ